MDKQTVGEFMELQKNLEELRDTLREIGDNLKGANHTLSQIIKNI